MTDFGKREIEDMALIYTKGKLEEVGELETPCAGIMYSFDEANMLLNLSKESRPMAIHYALCIGFANGVRHKGGGVVVDK